MFKRILALLLCVIMIVPIFASCETDDGSPEGMYSVTLNGEPFVLYVPQTWTDNRDSGISSAYYSLSMGIMATAKHFPCDKEVIDAGIEAYVKTIKDQNATLLKEQKYKLISEGEDRLSTNLAHKYIYSYDYDGESKYNLTVCQYYTFHAGNVIVLSLYSASEYYSETSEDFSMIKSHFIISEKKVSDAVDIDDDTPEGMKKASSDDLQYACYVPSSWITNIENKMTYAYYPTEGTPNVSVTCYSPDADYTVNEFYEKLKTAYKHEKYEIIGEPEDRKVAGRNAISFEYIITQVDGGTEKEYKLMQVVIGYNGLMYSITYTAPKAIFDNHLEDVNRIIETFRFR